MSLQKVVSAGSIVRSPFRVCGVEDVATPGFRYVRSFARTKYQIRNLDYLCGGLCVCVCLSQGCITGCKPYQPDGSLPWQWLQVFVFVA